VWPPGHPGGPLHITERLKTCPALVPLTSFDLEIEAVSCGPLPSFDPEIEDVSPAPCKRLKTCPPTLAVPRSLLCHTSACTDQLLRSVIRRQSHCGRSKSLAIGYASGSAKTILCEIAAATLAASWVIFNVADLIRSSPKTVTMGYHLRCSQRRRLLERAPCNDWVQEPSRRARHLAALSPRGSEISNR
jgi:hypothetical protein